MLDPPDRAALWNDLLGDQGIATSPTEAGVRYTGEVVGTPNMTPIRLFQNFSQRALAAGAKIQCRMENMPEYWCVSLQPAANTSAEAYESFDPGNGAPVHFFGVGGMAVLPARSTDFSVLNTSANPVNVTLWGVRGFPLVQLLGGSS